MTSIVRLTLAVFLSLYAYAAHGEDEIISEGVTTAAELQQRIDAAERQRAQESQHEMQQALSSANAPVDSRELQKCVVSYRDKCGGQAKCMTNRVQIENHCRTANAATTTPPTARVQSHSDLVEALFHDSRQELRECVPAAREYCGYAAKQMDIDKDSIGCLYQRVTRTTRERLPHLDGTACARTINQLTAGYQQQVDRYGTSIYSILEANSQQLQSSCASASVPSCETAASGYPRNRCYFGLSTRDTRNGIPGFDGTACDRVLRGIAQRAASERNQGPSNTPASSQSTAAN